MISQNHNFVFLRKTTIVIYAYLCLQIPEFSYFLEKNNVKRQVSIAYEPPASCIEGCIIRWYDCHLHHWRKKPGFSQSAPISAFIESAFFQKKKRIKFETQS